MERYDIIFCVLTYKNSDDLLEFVRSLRENKKINFSYKIVVVNNYADDSSLEVIKDIAMKNNCVLIESENKGYSYGNNLGIDYVKSNFEFDYLVVCNPDTYII